MKILLLHLFLIILTYTKSAHGHPSEYEYYYYYDDESLLPAKAATAKPTHSAIRRSSYELSEEALLGAGDEVINIEQYDLEELVKAWREYMKEKMETDSSTSSISKSTTSIPKSSTSSSSVNSGSLVVDKNEKIPQKNQRPRSSADYFYDYDEYSDVIAPSRGRRPQPTGNRPLRRRPQATGGRRRERLPTTGSRRRPAGTRNRFRDPAPVADDYYDYYEEPVTLSRRPAVTRRRPATGNRRRRPSGGRRRPITTTTATTTTTTTTTRAPPIGNRFQAADDQYYYEYEYYYEDGTKASPESSTAKAKQQFTCEPRDQSYRTPDDRQCDKFYECNIKGEEKEMLCPDGLVYETGSQNCDYPAKVNCTGRPDLQPAQPSDNCPRANGFFAWDAEESCQKFWDCRGGKSYLQECPQGVIFDPKIDACVTPDQSARPECAAGKVLGFECPTYTSDDILRFGNHDRLPNPQDCQQFFSCLRSGLPRLGACPKNTVFNPSTGHCDDPKNVKTCENYWKEKETEELKDYYQYYDG